MFLASWFDRRLTARPTVAVVVALAALVGGVATLADVASAGVIRVPLDVSLLQNALAQAAPGDTIQLAGNGGSTYYTNEDFSFEIPHDLTIQGGWRIDFTVRDPHTYVSVIRDVTNAFEKPIFRIDGSPRVVFDGVYLIAGRFGIQAEGGPLLIVKDCTFRDQRNAVISDPLDGAAVRIVGGELIMTGTTVRSVLTTRSGAALSIDGSRATILDSVLKGATASRDGGLVHVVDSDSVAFSNVDFESGLSIAAGGLVYAERSNLTVEGSTMVSGTASIGGGGIAARDCPTLRVTNTDISGCSSVAGGGIHATGTTVDLSGVSISGGYARDGGGGAMFEQVAFSLDGCTFDHNFSDAFNVVPDRGGAIFSLASDGTVANSDFLNGFATGRGGAWSQVGGEVGFTNCRFLDNECDFYGGALQIELGGSFTLTNCLLEGNLAKFGGGIATSFTGQIMVSQTTMTGNSGRSSGAAVFADTGGRVNAVNSIFCCAPRGDLVFCSSAEVSIEYTNLWNDDSVNQRGELGGSCPDALALPSNLSADPGFCDPSGADGWTVSAGSPCVGAASDGGVLGWAGVGCAVPQVLRLESSTWGRIKARYR